MSLEDVHLDAYNIWFGSIRSVLPNLNPLTVGVYSASMPVGSEIFQPFRLVRNLDVFLDANLT